MKNDLLSFTRVFILFLRLKLLNLTSGIPPFPGGVLDEQTAVMHRGQMLLGETPLDQISPAQTRLNIRKGFSLLKIIGGNFEKVGSVRKLAIRGPAGEIPARLYLPGRGTSYALFVFLHGGGWVIGDLDTADNMARFLCRHVNCVVLSVEYHLALEHIFPGAVDGFFAAVQWAMAHAGELGCDPKRVPVGGDSAGGNLTAVVAQMARQDGDSMPRAGTGTTSLAEQVLLYPSTNAATLDTPSYKDFGDQFLSLPRREVDWYLEQYTPNPKNRLNPQVSPLLADDLRGLPPALVVTAEFDVLRDEGEAHARRMQEAGVKVQLMCCNDMVHVIFGMLGLIKRASQNFERVAAEIRKIAAA